MNEDRDEASSECASADSSGRLSRRTFLKVSTRISAVVAGSVALSACMPRPTATRVAGTTPKSLALYQDTPNQGRRCAGCTHFREPNACGIVAGEISPNGWCRYYERRPV